MPQNEMESNLNPRLRGEQGSLVVRRTEDAAAADPQSCTQGASKEDAMAEPRRQVVSERVPFLNAPPVDVWRHLSEEEEARVSEAVAERLRSGRDDANVAQETVRFLVDLGVQGAVRWWYEYVLEQLTQYGKETVAEPVDVASNLPVTAKYLDYWNGKRKDAAGAARDLRDRLRELALREDPDVKKAVIDGAVEWAVGRSGPSSDRLRELVKGSGDRLCVVIVAKQVAKFGMFKPSDVDRGILIRAARNSFVPYFKKLPGLWNFLKGQTEDDLVGYCVNSLLKQKPPEEFCYRSFREARAFIAERIKRHLQEEGLLKKSSVEADLDEEYLHRVLEEVASGTGSLAWPLRHLHLWLLMKEVFKPEDAIRFWLFLKLREQFRLEWKDIVDILANRTCTCMTESDLPPGVTWEQGWAACMSGKVNSAAIRQTFKRMRSAFVKHHREAVD